EQVEIGVRYAGYIERQQQEVLRARRQEDTALPAGFDFSLVRGDNLDTHWEPLFQRTIRSHRQGTQKP
ncbi:MAG: hypothetical protein B7X58_16365, partial [Marinobacter sp. 34-60-7]